MQATLMQVPPTLSRSTMTTLSPALARSIARDLPAFPPPTTRRSTSSIGASAWLIASLLTMDWDMDAHLLRRWPVGVVWTPGQRGATGLYSGVTAGILSGSPPTREETSRSRHPSQLAIETTYPFILTDTRHRPVVHPGQPGPHPKSQQAWRNSRRWVHPWQSPRGPRYQQSREVTPAHHELDTQTCSEHLPLLDLSQAFTDRTRRPGGLGHEDLPVKILLPRDR